MNPDNNLVEVVRVALNRHVEDEAEQLERIDRVMERLADRMSLATRLAFLAFVVMVVVAALEVGIWHQLTTGG